PHPPDRLKSGSRRKHCRRAASMRPAGTMLPRKNSHNACAPAACNIHGLEFPRATVQEVRIQEEACCSQTWLKEHSEARSWQGLAFVISVFGSGRMHSAPE